MNNDEFLTEEEAQQGLDLVEKDQLVDIKIENGKKLYKVNKKGRQYLVSRAVYALETLGFDLTESSIKSLKQFVESGEIDAFTRNAIDDITPFVLGNLDWNLADNELQKEFADRWKKYFQKTEMSK